MLPVDVLFKGAVVAPEMANCLLLFDDMSDRVLDRS